MQIHVAGVPILYEQNNLDRKIFSAEISGAKWFKCINEFFEALRLRTVYIPNWK